MITSDQYRAVYNVYKNLEQDLDIRKYNNMNWKSYLEIIMLNQGHEHHLMFIIIWC